jgi:hypothetical protein
MASVCSNVVANGGHDSGLPSEPAAAAHQGECYAATTHQMEDLFSLARKTQTFVFGRCLKVL